MVRATLEGSPVGFHSSKSMKSYFADNKEETDHKNPQILVVAYSDNVQNIKQQDAFTQGNNVLGNKQKGYEN